MKLFLLVALALLANAASDRKTDGLDGRERLVTTESPGLHALKHRADGRD